VTDEPDGVTRELRGLLIDPVDGARGGRLTLEGGVIGRVEPDDAVEEPYVFPGFVDLQIYDFTLCREQGVTAYLATVGTSAKGTVEQFLEALPDETSCLGGHVEGPYLNLEAAGAQAAEHIRPVDFAELDRWLATGRVRILTLAPEVEGALEAIDRIVAAGAVAALGHTAANVYTTRAAIDRGATFATHLWNAMSGFRARTPGAIGTLLADGRITLGLVGDGRHLHPITEELTVRAAGPARIALTSDLVGPPQELSDGKLLGGDRSGARIVERFARRFGLPEVAEMSSLTPARALGLSDRGRLAVGYRADLAILGRDFRPIETIVAGETVFAQ
jgi:N-acetylglucosamine-6-phosphate deacetylase